MKETEQHSHHQAEEMSQERTQNMPQTYQAFLLRLWHEDGSPQVRATLEDAQTRQRIGFANLQHLFTFIERVTNHQPDKD